MNNKNKDLHYWMRVLHHDLGYLAIGLTLIYALSGLVLIYRNTDLMKADNHYAVTIEKGLDSQKLAKALNMKAINVTNETGQRIEFTNGWYDKQSGLADYTVRELVFPLNKMTRLHKTTGNDGIHYFAVIYGVILAFLALSSLFMAGKGKGLRRNVLLIVTGVALSVGLILLL